jgi:Fe-S-cluster containining protein
MMSEQGAHCICCGTCCKKGGPALHLEDRPLLDQGLIPREMLCTFRRGEPVHDNVAGKLVFLQEEVVKVRGKGNTWTCVFFEEESRSCNIYAQRPAECRALACWDHLEISRMYDKERLTRRDIVRSPSALWDLIETHEAQCSIEEFGRLTARVLESEGRDKEAAVSVAEMIGKDSAYRELFSNRIGAADDLLAFLLGRPLVLILPMFGLRAERREGGVALVRDTTYLDAARSLQRSPSSRPTKVP